MKNSLGRLAVTSAIALSAATAQAEVNLEDTQQKVSYSVGILIAGQLANDFDDLDLNAFVAGFNQLYGGEQTQLSAQEAMAVVQAYQRDQQVASSANALAESEAFLAETAQQEGVKITKSGLQYKVLEAGAGKQPQATDTVTVHYRGTLMDGQEFDSSYSRGEPTSFPLNGVIPGWTEGLQLMSEGGKYEFYIHPDLAYGQRGAGGAIGPNAALVFQVELIKIGE
ncbi:MAG: FKBP-type peptidyl-prolyl cis-trans isomerase [Gammaproteobacteria bacterium]|jgi:FKBP-type peptidyl-prolyl cis-trans isomerase FklB|nr:FKBP-type peptidyl-prolyl cis-trans isomerase [Gammaproteobacteria bacterium]MDP6164866.1 FKBP-type peptidyl-prolyl cis-trans isomerase [Gammaproteobacteria bacterium]